MPSLTPVAQPLHEIGAAALRALLQRIESGQPGSHRVELATELVVRESTGPVPAG